MNQLIKWLFQRTSDGSTYLQVVILIIFAIFAIRVIAKTFQEIAFIFEEGGEIDDKTSL